MAGKGFKLVKRIRADAAMTLVRESMRAFKEG